ncbi:MAG: hypothetical protein CL933_14995 [Deltaproteobacteria bacterium]|nr:hypothetical protein [Deltaproteobacteria bacterium]
MRGPRGRFFRVLAKRDFVVPVSWGATSSSHRMRGRFVRLGAAVDVLTRLPIGQWNRGPHGCSLPANERYGRSA